MHRALPAFLLAASFAVGLCGGCSRGHTPIAIASAAPPPALEFVGEWGVHGQAPGQLDQPAGMAVDTVGRVYLPDRGTGLLEKFSVAGVPLLSFQDNAILGAAGVAVDSGGGIYVANARTGQIEVFFPEGDPLRALHVAPQPRFEGAFIFSVDTGGDIYVPDPAGKRIQVLSSKGQLIRSWRIAAGTPSDTARPIAAVAGPDGFVYVGDSSDGHIVKFSRTGERITEWGASPDAGGSLGLAVSEDHVFVLRGGDPRLEIWTLDGKTELMDDLGGRLGAGSSGAALALAPDSELLVLDAGAPRVLRFRLHLEHE